MRRAHLLFFAIVMLFSFSAIAQKEKSTIKITNLSKWEIHHLFLSPANEKEWGPDQLGDNVIKKGGTFTLTDIDCDHYDIKVVDEDGDECVIANEELCGHAATWKITDKELLACENK
jgi:hypothetical protein